MRAPRRSTAPSIWLPRGRAAVIATAAWIAVVGVSLFASIGPKSVDPATAAPPAPVEESSVLTPSQPATSNHDQDGQNVIFGDGEPPPFPNPFMGTQHDNIFAGRLQATSGPFTTTLPAGQTPDGDIDSILLPAVN